MTDDSLVFLVLCYLLVEGFRFLVSDSFLSRRELFFGKVRFFHMILSFIVLGRLKAKRLKGIE